MIKLIRKELALASHPAAFIFLALSAMMLIPDYPYYVLFFYTCLGLFFICLTGRENHDIYYTVTLPVKKTDAVAARFAFAVLLELVQMVICIPFALLRQSYTQLPGNQVGMDANIAFFGLSFVMLGIYNLVFFTKYYKNPDKVGRAFIGGSIAVFLYMAVAEVAAHVLPFMRDRLDTPDPQFLGEKLCVLGAGALIYAALTLTAFKRSKKSFDALDL